MTARTSLPAAVRLPEVARRHAADMQQPAMTVTVQITLPHGEPAGGRLPDTAGADSIGIAAQFAERLHTIASDRAREVVPNAGVSTIVSMVTQALGTEQNAGEPTLASWQGGLPTVQRARVLPRLVEPVPFVDERAAPGAAADAGTVRRAHATVGEIALEIIGSRREVLLDGAPVAFTRREYELLVFLAERPGRVFTRRQLLNWVWGEDVVSGERTVDVHVRRLRAKLRRRGPVITTIRGVGYRLDRAERVTVS